MAYMYSQCTKSTLDLCYALTQETSPTPPIHGPYKPLINHNPNHHTPHSPLTAKILLTSSITSSLTPHPFLKYPSTPPHSSLNHVQTTPTHPSSTPAKLALNPIFATSFSLSSPSSSPSQPLFISFSSPPSLYSFFIAPLLSSPFLPTSSSPPLLPTPFLSLSPLRPCSPPFF